MHPSIVQSVQIQGAITGLFLRALEGVSEEQALMLPAEGANPLLWVAGHLVTTRCLLARTVGLAQEIPWGGRFARGAALDLGEGRPALAEVRAKWEEISAALMARFEQLGEAELAGPAGSFPSLDRTVAGALAMAALHDSYHAGQLGLLRRCLGHPRLVG